MLGLWLCFGLFLSGLAAALFWLVGGTLDTEARNLCLVIGFTVAGFMQLSEEP